MTPLNEDAWAYVGLAAQPLEALRLTMTCKALRSCILTRSVWEALLGRSCHSLGIPLSTYPAQQMTMDDLVRAACAPALWMKNAHTLVRGDCYKISSSWSIPRGFYERLTAGGRYLFQAVNKDAVYIELQLWDFGPPIHSACSCAPVLLASYMLQASQTHVSISMCTTADTIRVALAVISQSDSLRCTVLSISPGNETRFCTLASAQFSYEESHCTVHLTGDYFQVESPTSKLLTWSYEKDLVSLWLTPMIADDIVLVPLSNGVVVANHTVGHFYFYSLETILARPTVLSPDATVPYPPFEAPHRSDSMFNAFYILYKLSMRLQLPLEPTRHNPVMIHSRYAMFSRSYSIEATNQGERWEILLRPVSIVLDVVDEWRTRQVMNSAAVLRVRRYNQAQDEVKDSVFKLSLPLSGPYGVAHSCHLTGRTIFSDGHLSLKALADFVG